jgi:hypothetical protein
MSIIIDLFIFLPVCPMQMSITNYLMDIGITYLIVPSVTVGREYMADNFEIK